jgi:hypothetical protein
MNSTVETTVPEVKPKRIYKKRVTKKLVEDEVKPAQDEVKQIKDELKPEDEIKPAEQEVSPLNTINDLLASLPVTETTEIVKEAPATLEKKPKRVYKKRSEKKVTEDDASTASATSVEKKKRISKKKTQESAITVEYETEVEEVQRKKICLPDFTEEGPALYPYNDKLEDNFATIFKSVFIKNHKYVSLRICNENLIHPAFFVVTGSEWQPNMEVQFVKHETTIDEAGLYHVKPVWEQLWSVGYIDEQTMYNCMPFDELRDYNYEQYSL